MTTAAVPGSPAMSSVSTPTKAGPFSSFMSSWRPGGSPKTVSGSPHSFTVATDDGIGTPKAAASGSKFFPSYANGARKREIIKEQQGQMDMLNMQVQQQGNELKRMLHQLEGERSARVELHERLNMQYLKSNLLVDMLVLRLLETSTTVSSKAGATTHTAAQHMASPAAAATATTAAASGQPSMPTQQQQGHGLPQQASIAAPSTHQQQQQQPQQQQPTSQHVVTHNTQAAGSKGTASSATSGVAAKVAAAVAHDHDWDVSSVEDA